MCKNGREARLVSQVNILPSSWPPPIVVWSAEIATAVTGPDSTATRCCQRCRNLAGDRDLPFVPGPMIILRFWL